MKKTIYLLAIAVFTLTASNTYGQSHAEHSKEMQKEKSHNQGDHDRGTSDATTQKNGATTDIVKGYLEIKNALTKDDQKGAVKGAKALLAAFSTFDMSSLTKSQHMEYMEIVEKATEHAKHISETPIDKQREHFEVLSTDINDLIALVGTDMTLYEDFCPMANDGKGAIWLSENEEIKNPFFGTKMLSCGKLQKQIN